MITSQHKCNSSVEALHAYDMVTLTEYKSLKKNGHLEMGLNSRCTFVALLGNAVAKPLINVTADRETG